MSRQRSQTQPKYQPPQPQQPHEHYHQPQYNYYGPVINNTYNINVVIVKKQKIINNKGGSGGGIGSMIGGFIEGMFR